MGRIIFYYQKEKKMSYQHINTELREDVYTITLNRPGVLNALNGQMVGEMIHAMGEASESSRARVVVLRGEGPAFCAGGDIHFLEQAHGTAQLPAFAEKLQELLFELVHCPLPVISLAHGRVYGGALGLLAASDIVISETDTRFSFSETKIGMVPAAILPFINKRIGTTNTRYLMLTAMVFDAEQARAAGLVNQICPDGTLQDHLDDIIREMRQSSPEATILTKQIINAIDNRNVLIDSASYSINFYQDINRSAFVREGLQAFREKRKPSWMQADKNQQ